MTRFLNFLYEKEAEKKLLSRSAHSGTPPSGPTRPTELGDTKEHAKALLQDTDNIRVHLRANVRTLTPRKTIGASRALAAARQLMNSTDSALHRPPVSTPTTTSLQRSPANSSAYLRSFSLLACNKTTPSVCDVFGTAALDAVKSRRIVMSTAQLCSLEQRKTAGQHLNGAFIVGGICHVHVGLPPHSGPCLATHPGECAFGSNCACT